MPKVTEATHGAPCWVDLTSRDLESVKPFYRAVLGWEFADMGPEYGGYNIVSKDGADLGGAMQFNPDFMPEDTPCTWGLYFSTEDIDASLAEMKARGAHPIMEPMQVDTQGKNVFVIDPQGAGVGLWQPMDRIGFDYWGEPGFPAWFELHTRDFDAASRFYSEVLGAELGSDEMGEGMRYHTLNIDGDPKAGIWDITDMLPADVPAGWNVYFHVKDLEAALEAVRTNGGTVLMEPEETPYGRMANVMDPAGAPMSLIE